MSKYLPKFCKTCDCIIIWTKLVTQTVAASQVLQFAIMYLYFGLLKQIWLTPIIFKTDDTVAHTFNVHFLIALLTYKKYISRKIIKNIN